MRVVLDGRIVLPRMTGAGRYVVEVARRLPALGSDLDVVLLLHPSLRNTNVPVTMARHGVTVEYVDLRVASWRQWIGIPGVLTRMKASLYHYPFLDLPLTSVPSVVTAYDLNPILDVAYFEGWAGVAKRAVARRLIGSTLRRSRVVLAISEATRRLIAEHYPRFAHKVRTTHLGVDSEAWASPTPMSVAVPAASETWEKRPYVLYVGVDRPHKNLVRLVRAFDRFRSAQGGARGTGPYLWLAGVGNGSEELRQEVVRLALGADVRLTGALSEELLASVYCRAVAFVYVSTSEGFGLPILEAFAAGTPVIAANASSLPEVGGDGAVYADPHSDIDIALALGRVWGDERLRSTLIKRGRKRAVALSWDATAEATLAAYRDAIVLPGSYTPDDPGR